MNFLGIITAIASFLIIGICHPIVIKSEYYFGTRCWWVFFIVGISFLTFSLMTDSQYSSIIFGVAGCSSLWSILEIFEQRRRVEKGWFPMNPKRKEEYNPQNTQKNIS